MQYDVDNYDEKQWEEFQRFSLEKNVKLKDLNRRNDRSISVIKNCWSRSKPNHVELAMANPFSRKKILDGIDEVRKTKALKRNWRMKKNSSLKSLNEDISQNMSYPETAYAELT